MILHWIILSSYHRTKNYLFTLNTSKVMIFPPDPHKNIFGIFANIGPVPTKTKIWVSHLQKKLKFFYHQFFVFVILFTHKDSNFSDRCQLVTWSCLSVSVFAWSFQSKLWMKIAPSKCFYGTFRLLLFMRNLFLLHQQQLLIKTVTNN